MNDQQIKGTLATAKGRIEAFLGRLTGNRRQEAGGVIHQVEGTVRHGVGDVQQAAEHQRDPDAPTR